jgi:hypothetical protein
MTDMPLALYPQGLYDVRPCHPPPPPPPLAPSFPPMAEPATLWLHHQPNSRVLRCQ